MPINRIFITNTFKRFGPILHLGFVFPFLLLFVTCKTKYSTIDTRPMPSWVSQRPVNSAYYIGIGSASHYNNPYDYQQIAKRNALNDLTGEIKVKITSNSILSQSQNNNEISQQFMAYTKLSVVENIEHYDIVDSWDDGKQFYIYYRLSKADYQSQIQNRIERAINYANDLLIRSDPEFSKTDFIHSLRLKCKALSALQDYLNEDLRTTYKNKDVYLVNEILEQIQSMLSSIHLQANVKQLQAKAGQALVNPIEIKASNVNFRVPQPIEMLPLKAMNAKEQFITTPSDFTDENGVGIFNIQRVLSAAPGQQFTVGVDIMELASDDTIHIALKSLLKQLDVPKTSIHFQVEAIKICINSKEKTLGNINTTNILTESLKKELLKNGCVFTKDSASADFLIYLESDTKSQGAIWGNMLYATLDYSIKIINNQLKAEIYSCSPHDIRGYQLTSEKASLDAYANAAKDLSEIISPQVLESMNILQSDK